MDADDFLPGEEFTSATQIVRWAKDPQGRWCEVGAVVPGPLEFPLLPHDSSDRPMARLIGWAANGLLEHAYARGRRARRARGETDSCYISVWRQEAGSDLPAGAHVDPEEILLLEEQLPSLVAAAPRVEELLHWIRTGHLADT